MKNIYILFLFSIMLATCTKLVFAAPTPTPTKAVSPTQNVNAIEEQINSLKDRIASRVAQLKLVDKRGIIGTVTDVSETQITLNDSLGNTRFVDVDELTKFASPSAKDSFGISDITRGSTVGVLGLYNRDSRRILARFVDVLFMPTTVQGAVGAIDVKNFTITIIKSDNSTLAVDIADITKTSSFTKDGGLIKSGFSKIIQGERITVTGFFDKNNAGKIIASRVIIYPDLAINPSIDLGKFGISTEDITPSTGSGKKLVPIIK